jgi:GNAT superfamily N-acetyltransferase
MNIKCKVCDPDNQYKDQIIDVLQQQDDESRDNETTSDMSRNLFVPEDKTVTDREALEIYYKELAENVAVAINQKTENVIGFSTIKENDPFFANGALEYYPHIAVTHSAVDKDHRRQGVWTQLRKTIEQEIIPKYNIEYIISAVSEENIASQNANESIGMHKATTLNYDEDETTFVYAKHKSEITE